LAAMSGIRQAEVELGLDVDDDLSPLELSLFLDSVFFDSLFDSAEEDDLELLSPFASDEEDDDEDFEPLSLFDSPLVCPLRA
jgi:hypothetical protein